MNSMTEPHFKPYPNIAESFAIVGFIILGTVLLFPVMFLEDIIGKEVTMLILYLLSMGIPLWILYNIRRKKTGDRTFNLTIKNRRIIPFLILGSLALLFGIDIPIINLIPMSENMQKMFMEYMSMTGIFSFITIVIAAPVLEELLFRGIILDGLLKRYTPFSSILISSIIFGLVHLNPWQFIGGLTLGGFAGWVYFRTKSLLPCIIIHASVNLTVFILNLLYPDPSMNNSLVEFYGGIFNLILIISGSITILLACIIFLRKEFLKGDIKGGSTQTPNIITASIVE